MSRSLLGRKVGCHKEVTVCCGGKQSRHCPALSSLMGGKWQAQGKGDPSAPAWHALYVIAIRLLPPTTTISDFFAPGVGQRLTATLSKMRIL